MSQVAQLRQAIVRTKEIKSFERNLNSVSSLGAFGVTRKLPPGLESLAQLEMIFRFWGLGPNQEMARRYTLVRY